MISGRLSRLDVDATGAEQVLIEDWCQQYPSHSIGSLAFGADGALYVSARRRRELQLRRLRPGRQPASTRAATRRAASAARMTPPTAEGGALRSQDVRTTGDPTGLDGAILRVDPATGAAHAGQPDRRQPDPNARRIVAYGLRNPFRITIRPGTNEVWVGDVGWNTWEEIDRVPTPDRRRSTNFGWPCYEGNGAPERLRQRST